MLLTINEEVYGYKSRVAQRPRPKAGYGYPDPDLNDDPYSKTIHVFICFTLYLRQEGKWK